MEQLAISPVDRGHWDQETTRPKRSMDSTLLPYKCIWSNKREHYSYGVSEVFTEYSPVHFYLVQYRCEFAWSRQVIVTIVQSSVIIDCWCWYGVLVEASCHLLARLSMFFPLFRDMDQS